jgi:hypothetical protein
MEHRAPSSGVTAGVGSNLRRRSGGALAFKRRANDNPFPSSYSQPTISQDESTRSQILQTLSLGASDNPSGNSDLLDISVDSPPSSVCAQPPSVIRFPRVASDSSEPQPSGTTYARISVESGHGRPAQVLRITDKFTNKWPAPKNFKDPELQYKEGKPGTAAAPALEEGQGLGLIIAKWTIFKWCLFLSVMTVFAAGCAGLLVATMTWFNSKPVLSISSHSPIHSISRVYSLAKLSGDGRG